MLRAKKYAKMKKNLPESVDMLDTDMETHNSCCEGEARSSRLERPIQVTFKNNLKYVILEIL